MLNTLELTGRTRSHITENESLGFALHPQAATAYLAMRSEAAQAGFDLRIASSFRGFEAQLNIWNQKFLGQRVILDSSGNKLERNSLSPWELVQAILEWSGLPGASRHHWGTDFDFYEGKTSRSAAKTAAAMAADGDFSFDFSDVSVMPWSIAQGIWGCLTRIAERRRT